MEPNVLTSNGVIHIVNGVMLDTSSNATAVSSALAIFFILAFVMTCLLHDNSTGSATSTAAPTSTSTQTGEVSSPTPTQGSAVKVGANNWKLGALVGMIVSFGRFV